MSEIWALALNILKIAGLLATAIAGIVSILFDTKTPERSLTSWGKALLAIALIGAAMAVGAQIVEWVKTAEDEKTARLRNAEVLEQIQRAVTRIDSVSVSFVISIPENKLFSDYLSKVAKQIEDFTDQLPYPGEDFDGLEVMERNDWGVQLMNVTDRSLLYPTPIAYGEVGGYVLGLIPRIAIRKISNTNEPTKIEDLISTSQLNMTPDGGARSVRIKLDEREKPVRLIAFTARNLEIPESERGTPVFNGINSVPDLKDTQIFISFKKVYQKTHLINDLINSSQLYGFTITVNGHYFKCDNKQLEKVESIRYALVYKCPFPPLQ